MPKVTASNGIRPEYRALSVIKLNEPVTPSQINIQVGTGDYAAKYISFLRKDGFEFSTQKDGRQVVSYTLVKEPANVERFRSAATPKPSVVTPPVPKNLSLIHISEPTRQAEISYAVFCLKKKNKKTKKTNKEIYYN